MAVFPLALGADRAVTEPLEAVRVFGRAGVALLALGPVELEAA